MKDAVYIDADPGTFIHLNIISIMWSWRERCQTKYMPCHNQNVERAIKLVSEYSKKADREGFIQSVIASRSELPKFDTKKEFTVKRKNTEN